MSALTFLIVAIIKIAVTLGVLLTVVAYTVWLERKVVGRMQNRWGPSRVGPFGLLQPLADGIKFLLKEDLTPPYVRALITAGWEVDSHTVDHVDLTTLSAARLRYELVASRRDLRRAFGVPVNFFCYPSGSYDPAVVKAGRAAGYLAATTTNPGLAGPAQPYRLARLRVSNG